MPVGKKSTGTGYGYPVSFRKQPELNIKKWCFATLTRGFSLTMPGIIHKMEIMRLGYETFEHGADIGIRGKGRTLEEAFANGAKALFSLMADLSTVEPHQEIQVTCTAPDIEMLFVVWLNELIARADIEKAVLSEFSVTIKDNHLTATARGERIDPRRHNLGVEVKGATYTMLRVAKEDAYFVAQCVVDV